MPFTPLRVSPIFGGLEVRTGDLDVTVGAITASGDLKIDGNFNDEYWRDIAPPSGWTVSLPYTIQKSTPDKYRIKPDWKIDDNAPTGKAYYVDVATGADINDGSSGSPFKTINKAVSQVDADVVYVEAGVYQYANSLTAGFLNSISLIAINGRVITGPFYNEKTWTADGDAYKTTASSSVYTVIDASITDEYGDYEQLIDAGSIANCKATPGTFYVDGTTTYVRTSDSREPDTDIYLIIGVNNFNFNIAGGTLYCEGFDFVGGVKAFRFGKTSTTTVYFNDCTFKYSTETGVGMNSTEEGIGYFKDCVAAKNVGDGFSYTTAGVCGITEISCIGRDNGKDGSDNGSSMHTGGWVVRINGEYTRNIGPNLADISADTKSWCLGCFAHDSMNTFDIPSDYTIELGNIVWLDGCVFTGSERSLYAGIDSVYYKRGVLFTGTEVGDGSFEIY